MRSLFLCLALTLLTASTWAQGDAAPAPAQAPPAAAPMHRHHDMAAMHQAHLQEMKDQVAKMRATLEQLKANLAKVKDPALKQQSQLDVDLWEGMVKHMEGMVEMMSHGGMGPGMGAEMGAGMMGGGMHEMRCCAGMKDGACCGGNKCMQGMKDKAATPAPDSDKQ